MGASPNWWKSCTFYQIWPTSYKDSNGDGIGDIPGIISTLPYLAELGVDAIWLSPMYASPQKDFGYDISNYEDIYPPFGTLDDMQELIDRCHDHGMKIIVDLVINHTSNEHAWFKDSRSSKTSEKSDWYIWRDPKVVDGVKQPPNNWAALFGGSAWEYAPERDQYYLHLFLPEQPDLNWENDDTRQGIYQSACQFWLDRGVDGFRVDTVNLYSKNQDFPDAAITVPDAKYQPCLDLVVNGPRMHEWLHEQRTKVYDKYGDVFIVGELALTPVDELVKYISTKARELSCVFDFQVFALGALATQGVKKYQVYKAVLPDFKRAWLATQDVLNKSKDDVWITAFTENHDMPRCLTRFATDEPEHREQAAKVMATLVACLSGSLFMYQGQEIGMVNFPKTWGISDIKDPDALNAYKDTQEEHDNDPLWLDKAMAGLQHMARDNARLPVQWDSSANAGFTTGKPWMRVHDNYKTLNVADQQKDPQSPLKYWQAMLKLRKEYPELTTFGDFELWDQNELDTFTFIKSAGQHLSHDNQTETVDNINKEKQKLVVFLSFSDKEQPFSWPTDCKNQPKKLLISNVSEPGKYLSPWESRVYLVSL